VNIFGFNKDSLARHILVSNSANCTVLRAVVLTQYRVTDRQTDGIAIASTALAMLRRAVKRYRQCHNQTLMQFTVVHHC